MAGRKDKERHRRDDETSQGPREDWIHVDAGRTEKPQLLDRNLHPDMYFDRRHLTSSDRAVDYVTGQVQTMSIQVADGYTPDHYPPSFDSSAPTDNTVKDDITMRPPTPTWRTGAQLTEPNMKMFNQAQYPNTVADWVTAPNYIISSIPKKDSHTAKRSFVSNSSSRSHADIASTAANDGLFAAGALFNDVPAYANYPQDIAMLYPTEYVGANGDWEDDPQLDLEADYHHG